MSQILAQYEHKEEGSKEIQLFPVSISDVDELWIWLTVHKSPFEQWHVAVPWSQIVSELLPRGVKHLLESDQREEHLYEGVTAVEPTKPEDLTEPN